LYLPEGRLAETFRLADITDAARLDKMNHGDRKPRLNIQNLQKEKAGMIFGIPAPALRPRRP
jgi:hypothetical protein